MNNKPVEKTNRWKQIIRWVVHFLATLLGFMPILIITYLIYWRWVSGSSELVISIPNPTITVVVILVAYMIAFLIHKKGFQESRNIINRNFHELSCQNWVKETLSESLKLAVFPALILLSIARQFLLLLTVIVPFVLTILLTAICVFLILITTWKWFPLEIPNSLAGVFDPLVQFVKDWEGVILIFGLLVIPALISYLTYRSTNEIKESIKKMFRRISKVCSGRWLPEVNPPKTQKPSEEAYIVQVRRSFRQSVVECKKLFLAALSLTIFFIFGLLYDAKEPGVTSNGPDPDCSVKAVDDDSLSISYTFEKGSRFSLFYREGNLETKEGICPEGSNLEWLKLFKAALSDNNEGKTRLKVQGFASVSPVHVDGETSASKELNLQIANERAEAIVYYLTMHESKKSPAESCSSAVVNRLIWTRPVRDESDSIWSCPNFEVIYNPWNDFDEMNSSKPRPNPHPGVLRQFDVEFLNRSVQIVIEKGSIRTNATPGSPVDDKTNRLN